MKDGPLVSIVSVFHNRVGLVEHSVQSLLAQDYPRLEIVIFDDGSTDGTAEALSALDDPRLRVVKQDNAGFTTTLNRAIRASTGEIVALHGSGDIASPQRISKQVELLLSSDDVGLTGCLTDRSHGRVGPVTKRNHRLSGNIHRKALKGGLIFTHGAAMFRRKLFDEIGGYREFFIFSQGRDFYLRMPPHLRYAIVPEHLYIKITPPGSISTDARRLVLQRYLNEFAVQCARARDQGEPDPLDKHGPAAAFLREKSMSVQWPLYRLGLHFLLFGDESGGRRLLGAAAEERLTWRAIAGRTLIAASRRPAMWRLLRPALRRFITARAASHDSQ